MKNPFRSTVVPVKCLCGHQSCDTYHLSVGRFTQGTGWSREEAEFVCEAINSYGRHRRGPFAAIRGLKLALAFFRQRDHVVDDRKAVEKTLKTAKKSL